MNAAFAVNDDLSDRFHYDPPFILHRQIATSDFFNPLCGMFSGRMTIRRSTINVISVMTREAQTRQS